MDLARKVRRVTMASGRCWAQKCLDRSFTTIASWSSFWEKMSLQYQVRSLTACQRHRTRGLEKFEHSPHTSWNVTVSELDAAICSEIHGIALDGQWQNCTSGHPSSKNAGTGSSTVPHNAPLPRYSVGSGLHSMRSSFHSWERAINTDRESCTEQSTPLSMMKLDKV